MRIDEHLPWDALADEHRMLSGKVGFENPQEFIEQELENFLSGYRRCLAHRQDHYIEVWIEKAVLYHIVKPVVNKYCRRLVCCRGYNSITFQADLYNRALEVLIAGDNNADCFYFFEVKHVLDPVYNKAIRITRDRVAAGVVVDKIDMVCFGQIENRARDFDRDIFPEARVPLT